MTVSHLLDRVSGQNADGVHRSYIRRAPAHRVRDRKCELRITTRNHSGGCLSLIHDTAFLVASTTLWGLWLAQRHTAGLRIRAYGEKTAALRGLSPETDVVRRDF
jgi:hypothetical protein